VAAFYPLPRCLFYWVGRFHCGGFIIVFLRPPLRSELKKVVHWMPEILFAAEIAFRCLVDHSARIVLSSDHKAEFVHVPEDYLGKAACSVTGRGSWLLGKNDSFSVVRVSIVNEEPNSPCKWDFAYELMLYGRKSPYKLHITIGDPDSGDAVQSEKQH